MSGVDLNDSYQRLTWVNELADRAKDLALPTAVAAAKATSKLSESRDANGHTLHRFVRDDIPIPKELGFLIGDIVVNARSCLDMAMTAIAGYYGLAWRSPQFPMSKYVDDGGELVDAGAAWAGAKGLPLPVRKVVVDAQPRYVDGDEPRNVTALALQGLSNANKHNNLTPVAIRHVISGFQNVQGEQVERADEHSWPVDWRSETTVMVLRTPSGIILPAQLEAIVHADVAIKGGPKGELTLYQAPTKPGGPRQPAVTFPFRLHHALTGVPRYTSSVLSNLLRACRYHDERVPAEQWRFRHDRGL